MNTDHAVTATSAMDPHNKPGAFPEPGPAPVGPAVHVPDQKPVATPPEPAPAPPGPAALPKKG